MNINENTGESERELEGIPRKLYMNTDLPVTRD